MLRSLKTKVVEKFNSAKMSGKAAYLAGESYGTKKFHKKGFNIGTGIIGVVVALVIVLALVPTVNNQATVAELNSSGAAATMYGLIGLVFAAGIVMAGAKFLKK